MGDVLTEVLSAAKRQGERTRSVRLVPDARPLFERALQTFPGGKDARWWWEHLPESTVYREIPDDCGFEHLVEIVPDPDERLYFVVEDDDEPFFPFLEATAREAHAIIGDSFAFEYYLVHPTFSWLVGENHHSQLFAFGPPMAGHLARLHLDDAAV